MLLPVLAVLGASPALGSPVSLGANSAGAVASAAGSKCDSALPAPKIPLASEFECPSGATQEARGAGIECIGRDGRTTGDTFAVDGKTGLQVHPLGLTVAWDNGVVSWWHQRPTGQRVAYEAGKPVRVEYFEGGDLQCARHFEGPRLSKKFEGGKWSWLDKQGKAIEPTVPLEKGELLSVAREHQAEVQLCYESRLHEVKGEFRGKVVMLLTIEKGAVKQVKAVEDTLHDPPVSECIVARINEWKYRPANEEVDVAYPFVFKEHP